MAWLVGTTGLGGALPQHPTAAERMEVPVSPTESQRQLRLGDSVCLDQAPATAVDVFVWRKQATTRQDGGVVYWKSRLRGVGAQATHHQESEVWQIGRVGTALSSTFLDLNSALVPFYPNVTCLKVSKVRVA